MSDGVVHFRVPTQNGPEVVACEPNRRAADDGTAAQEPSGVTCRECMETSVFQGVTKAVADLAERARWSLIDRRNGGCC